MKDDLAQFPEKKNGRWGDFFYLKFWVNASRLSEIVDFEPIIARSVSTITSSEKSSINTTESPLRAFQ